MIKEIVTAIKPTLVEMAGSKKVLAGISGVLVQLGACVLSLLHLNGLEPDQAAVDRYIALVIAYIIGQSVVDHGKPAAQIQADSVAAMDAQHDTLPTDGPLVVTVGMGADATRVSQVNP